MFNVLQARNIPSKLLMFPDENHVSKILETIQVPRSHHLLVGSEARELPRLAQRGAGLDQQVQRCLVVIRKALLDIKKS